MKIAVALIFVFIGMIAGMGMMRFVAKLAIPIVAILAFVYVFQGIRSGELATVGDVLLNALIVGGIGGVIVSPLLPLADSDRRSNRRGAAKE